MRPVDSAHLRVSNSVIPSARLCSMRSLETAASYFWSASDHLRVNSERIELPARDIGYTGLSRWAQGPRWAH